MTTANFKTALAVAHLGDPFATVERRVIFDFCADEFARHYRGDFELACERMRQAELLAGLAARKAVTA